VLDEQVCGADLPRLGALSHQATAVVLGHVKLQLLCVGARRGFPSRVLLCRVEVVRQVLALTVAHLPVGGEAHIGVLRGGSARGGTAKREGSGGFLTSAMVAVRGFTRFEVGAFEDKEVGVARWCRRRFYIDAILPRGIGSRGRAGGWFAGAVVKLQKLPSASGRHGEKPAERPDAKPGDVLGNLGHM
jgi:hypothetical protein